MPIRMTDLKAIRLKLASPEDILAWSHGEILRPETINYRTQKPERDGLFDEKIFGPVKDWECACGKYKRIRYKGVICDKCGVEVTRAIVRRERMGHISLLAPVAHIWFLRGVPSSLSLILDLSVQNLEKVIYFAEFIITRVDESLKKELLQQIESEFKAKQNALKADEQRELSKIVTKYSEEKTNPELEEDKNRELEVTRRIYDEKLKRFKEALDTARQEITSIAPFKIISKSDYQDLSLKYGQVFEAGIGAEAIRELLKGISLEKLAQEIEKQIETVTAQQHSRLTRRLKIIKLLINNKIRPEWMILTVLPVVPPDLRPMVPLDGGRYASSDLNDLYRRVINRNNRLRRLQDLNAPEVICRNEKRMLQEAVDALIDNSARHTKTVQASTGQRRTLRSLADTLRGKQGRFRQNLLGKRVDYSGRSVIVVGPTLKLDQCGLPKIMALELFKPFVMSKLIERGLVHNIRSASRMVESAPKEVWDILEEITQNSCVLLNRAPTLHRLSVQAFRPILIEGKAIQIHPMVCPPFNADFDGDQMAVHVPLTKESTDEAKNIMLAAKNLLKPATGEPVTTPTQDIIWGIYYLTSLNKGEEDKDSAKLPAMASFDEVLFLYHNHRLALRERIKVKCQGKIIETTAGRVIFNSILEDDFRSYDKVFDKKEIRILIGKIFQRSGPEKTADLLDKIKTLSLKYLTTAGYSWGLDDLPVLTEKEDLIKEIEQKLDSIEGQYQDGLLTYYERHVKIIELWTEVKEKITKLCQNRLDPTASIHSMITSGARGSWGQLTQMMGMKGLVTNPQGETIELPVKSSFKEGFDVLEYFISTHGARKGLADTALRTASAGYLTRRLVDVAQGLIITEKSCTDKNGLAITKQESEEIGVEFDVRVLGRTLSQDIINPKNKRVIAQKGQIIDSDVVSKIISSGVEEVATFSMLTCKSIRGVCQKCYGWDLGYNKPVKIGTAVGIIAAQSIGEPGTQLTMRTFHTGGVAGLDITQGLPRVEEIFENRPPRRQALLAEEGGLVTIGEEEGQRKITVTPIGQPKTKSKVKTKQIEYFTSLQTSLLVKNGDSVEKGQRLTEGDCHLEELNRLKGKEAVQKYIMKEIQNIYSSQGQKLNDKHIEVIIRQMFSRVKVTNPGDTPLLPGEIVARSYFEEANQEAKKNKQEPAKGDELLLGISRVSLSTESFLSAASFQETARILINAAVSGKVDKLRGLKENVIIGRLIPAGTGFGVIR